MGHINLRVENFQGLHLPFSQVWMELKIYDLLVGPPPPKGVNARPSPKEMAWQEAASVNTQGHTLSLSLSLSLCVALCVRVQSFCLCAFACLHVGRDNHELCHFGDLE
jgi:hypothetical protein